MNTTTQIEITPEQRSLLLDGLSFLRSYALLDARLPSEEVEQDREQQLRVIEELAEQLGGQSSARSTASV